MVWDSADIMANDVFEAAFLSTSTIDSSYQSIL